MAQVQHNYTPTGDENTNIKVYIRARPPAVETDSDFLEVDEEDKRKLMIKDPRQSGDDGKAKHGEVSFQYDHVFWKDVQQSEVFQSAATPLIENVLSGYNASCFACKYLASVHLYIL